MNRALINSLTEAEYLLVRETENPALAELDEDELVALHDRVRRARTKYTTLYRREASAKVRAQGGRGKARPKNTRNRERAEVFEDALARVSARLARVARASAKELRDARIAAARGEKAAGAAAKTTATKTATKQATKAPAKARGGKPAPNAKSGDRSLVSPRSVKKGASVQAKGARRQAKRDAR